MSSRDPGTSACELVYGAKSWVLLWVGLCPGRLWAQGFPKAAYLQGLVCVYAKLVVWPKVSTGLV